MSGLIHSFISMLQIELGVCVGILFPVDCRDSRALTYLVNEREAGSGGERRTTWILYIQCIQSFYLVNEESTV